jgi:hypothetical protein
MDFKNMITRLFIVLFTCIAAGSLLADIAQPTVSVSPNQTNTWATYTISSSTGNGDTNLDANADSIIIVFNSSTTVPNNITASLVTVNNTAVSVVTVSGRRVAILTPVNIARNGGPFTVVIDAAAKIKNPVTAGNYTLQVETTGNQDMTLVTSAVYLITSATSTVTPAAVTPNPSLAAEAASYTLGFYVGASGSLAANDGTIVVAFPSATTVPTGAISGVQVNGTPATASANLDTVTITTPINIDNNGSVQVAFALGSGLQNPGTDSTYTLSVRTSSEVTFVPSDNYTISPAGQLSISAITTRPDTVNQGGEFKFDFRTSSTGALAANSDTLSVMFSQNTYLPSNMSASAVTVTSGGYSDNASTVQVMKASTAEQDTVLIVTPINIGNSANVTLSFGTSAGYQNPSIAGNYKIRLKTSRDTSAVESNPFSVFNTATTVSRAVVSMANRNPNNVTSYTVNFTLGRLGRLLGGESAITLTFDNAYTLSTTMTTYNNSQIAVGSGSYISIPTANISPNNTTKTVVLTVPSSVTTSNGDAISVILAGTTTDPITNPNATGNYVLGVQTSVEATKVNSETYSIGGAAILINSVTLSTQNVNTAAQYTFGITTQNQLRNNRSDNIRVTFPVGTVLPSTIAAANVTIAGTAATSVTVNQESRTVSAIVTGNVNAGTFNVVISSAAGVINPPVPSTTYYKVTMNTSQDIALVTSSAYAIRGANTQVTAVSATANPAVVDYQHAAYAVNFTTSATGKIAGGSPAGSSVVTLDFDTATTVPASIPAGSVKVNSIVSGAVSILSSGLGGVVRVTLPNGLTIDNSTAVSVAFDTSAALNNGTTAGTYSVAVKTSSDTTNASGNYTLSAAQDLSITSVTPTPATQNASAGYSVRFLTGSTGALSVGDSIYIVFPVNTYLPATFSTSDLTVNGSNPTVTPVTQGNTLIIRTPVAVNSLANVTILINQTAGILNPTFVQSYTLQVFTQREHGPFTSPVYYIIQTTSTVSAADISVANHNPAVTSRYSINFNAGTNGRLRAGTSTITITFNSSTTISTTSTNYDSSYIVVDGISNQIPTSNISVSGQVITFTVPSGVSVDNNDNVTVILSRANATKPITNPGTNGNYTLQVRTSVETTNITSNSYVITNVAAVTNITVNVSPNVVNAASADTVNFQVQVGLAAGSGTITVTFPFNTYIPPVMTVSSVQVANGIAANPTNWTNASALLTNSSTRAVRITIPNAIAINDYVRVRFLLTAGIENPSVYGSYTLNVRTSGQPLDGISAAYTLQATTTMIANLTVAVTPQAPGEVGRYQFNFTTGSRGRLVSGASTITLLIPDNATFTQGVPTTSKVTVNSTAANALVLHTGTATNPDTLIITVPTSVTIGNSSNVTAVIDETAGLQNATSAALLSYGAFTSVETGLVQYDLSLPVRLTAFSGSSKEGKVVLEWTTQSEIENAYWIIEKKEITRSEFEQINNGTLKISNTGLAFNSFTQLSGQGNTSQETDYVAVDSLVQAGQVYAYRLADVTFSGAITYHQAILVEVTSPLSFNLAQNYPNPFNPATTISYSLPVNADVELRIYNVLGQEIITLVNATQKQGFYKLEWNGLNKNGIPVSSGVYFYNINMKSVEGKKSFTKTHKMVLVR